jgi:hypothetical protein
MESDKIGRTSPRTDQNGEGWCWKSRTLAVCEDSGVIFLVDYSTVAQMLPIRILTMRNVV